MPDQQAAPAQVQASMSNVTTSTPYTPPSGVTFDDGTAQSVGQQQSSSYSPPSGVTFDESSTQPANSGTQQEQSQSNDEGLLSRTYEHAIEPIANTVGGQIKHTVMAPIDAYHKAIDAAKAGDWKAATKAASEVVNTPVSYGIDKDSPIYKALASLITQPAEAIGDSYKQERASGKGVAEAALSTTANTLNHLPNESEIGETVGNIRKDISSGNWAGILGDAVAGVTTSKGAQSIPVAGGAISSGGKDFNTDMHDHNYMAAVGDILGTILPFGLGIKGIPEAEIAEDTTGVPPPPKPNVKPNLIRPTTTKVAGVNIPQAAEPGTGIVGRAARTMRSAASEAGAKKFVEEHVQPAARQATAANFVKSGLKDIDSLRELQGQPSTFEAPPQGIKSVSDVADFMHDEARNTYKELDKAAQGDVDNWESQYGEEGTVTKAQQAAKQTAGPVPAAPTGAAKLLTPQEGEAATQPQAVSPETPPKPKLFTEIQDQIRNATRVIDSEFTSQVDKQNAIEALPHYYQERANFLDKHSDAVSKGELAQADRVYAKGMRYDWIADRLDALTKGIGAGEDVGSTGQTPQMSLASLDKLPTAFDKKFGRDSFQDLVGSQGRANFNSILKALQTPATGSIIQKMLNEATLGVGKLATIPAGALLDRILFDPDFGKTVLKAADKAKSGAQAARDASFNAAKTVAKPAAAASGSQGKQQLKSVLDTALGGTPKKLTALSDSNNPAAAEVPVEVQNAVSTIPVQVKQGSAISDPNNRGGGVPIANVDQGAGNNTIEVNRPQDFGPAQKAHELVHVWQNNLPPSTQAKIPDDVSGTAAFDISDADKLRKQGKTMADLPREKAATIVQKYVEDPKGNANLKPWIDDMGRTALSSVYPTAPDAKRLNMNPRPPQLPDSSVAGMNSSKPTIITPSYKSGKVPGMIEKGNVDLNTRPNIKNPDSSHSSVFSMSFGTDKGEVLVPGVGDGKNFPLRQLTPKEALAQYKATGNSLGTFKTPAAANAYAQKLHEDQAEGKTR